MTIINPNFHFTNTTNRGNVTNAILIHHVAGRMSAARVHTMHQSPPRNWAGIGYHFHIDFDGTITQGRDMRHQGAHSRANNRTSIGIVLNGNFHTNDRVTDAQFNALVWLIRHIRGTYGDLPVIGHGEVSATACPGRHFPMARLREVLNAPCAASNPPTAVEAPRDTTPRGYTVKDGHARLSFGQTR